MGSSISVSLWLKQPVLYVLSLEVVPSSATWLGSSGWSHKGSLLQVTRGSGTSGGASEAGEVGGSEVSIDMESSLSLRLNQPVLYASSVEAVLSSDAWLCTGECSI